MKMGNKSRRNPPSLVVSVKTMIEPRTKLKNETSFSPKIRFADGGS